MARNASFVELIDQRVADTSSLLCIGLDPVPDRMPAGIAADGDGIVEFCRRIIEATAETAICYKPNFAFFAAFGPSGIDALAAVRSAIPRHIPALLDCKVGDVSGTAAAYASAWFDVFDFDGITVNPYLGTDSLVPFLVHEGRGVISVCKTSNPGSGEFQDQTMPSGQSLYLDVADRSREWNAQYPADVGLVVGATYPEQLAIVRERVEDQIILLPGVGAQSGDLDASVRAGMTSDGGRLLCSASRSIIFASSGPDFANAAGEAAIATRNEIARIRAEVVVAV